MQQFVGYEVAPGKEVPVTGSESTIFHLSLVALPHSANNAQATLYATVEGNTFAVASLNSKAKISQCTVDLIFPMLQSPVFTVKGNSSLHLTGYSQESGDDDMDMMGEDDFESASDDEDELPITKATKKDAVVQKKTAPAPVAAAEEESEEDDEEGDLDDLTSEELKQLEAEMEGEDDEELDDEEEEGEEGEESEGDEEDDEEGDLDDLTSEELKQLQAEMEEDEEDEDDEEFDEEEESEEEEEMPPVSKGRRPESGKPTAKFAGKPAQNNNSGRQGGKKAGRN